MTTLIYDKILIATVDGEKIRYGILHKDVSCVPVEGFKPFLGDTFIAIDQSVKKTGFINCIVIEE